MARDPLIGIVGKPSAGKSTTLNALTDASAKTGAFPFTTIDPNQATGYLQVACACGRIEGGKYKKLCKPNYGSCNHETGQRSVPIMLLDVAGLVPGAHEGRGLGNKFLDDLRHADALIHVVDVSGTTDAEGKATRGYDPLRDVEWLQDEIFRWVEGNLKGRWGSIVRRHTATKSTIVATLQNQFSGYGSTTDLVNRALDEAVPKLKERALENWDADDLATVVRAFTHQKFPTVLSLNKMDHPDADKNVSKIIKHYPNEKIVLTSAISEVFIRKLVKQKYVRYEEGTEFLDTFEDFEHEGTETDCGLKPLDERLKARVENVRDLVLYRFGSTGVVQVLQAAADILGLVPIYPVKNIHNFGAPEAVFRDCMLVKRGTTVAQVAKRVMGDIPIMYIEGLGGLKVAEDDTVDAGKNDVLSFKTGPRAK
ncbi:P-loop containing nucleoside triphosphate hydrolase protein [Nadsonia fulvescens var. elongata DSM 6958]|uniref:p-loop containing nucleoside triphosphate hydrolase protein n=1 Tax=Nadsonia fulvescens var. elongata DSM 6958 TaxID=857566 RepID=A0A1E3PQS5_9ASCO|nr:P-loop containing nucleoside triphosphate hydrolase protein [Nadsonia fulvescens var. elongata DSM 6958]